MSRLVASTQPESIPTGLTPEEKIRRVATSIESAWTLMKNLEIRINTIQNTQNQILAKMREVTDGLGIRPIGG